MSILLLYLSYIDLVSAYEFNHLRLIPASLMKSQVFLAKAIWTIVKHHKKLHYTEIEKYFYQSTNFMISDFYEFT
jgi:hypothetical protein